MSCDNYGLIAHYQKIIKRARNDEQKLHYCIEKLFGLSITIEHLQKTGIGKTINSLRKYNGEVGTAAKALVAKWKAMIADLDIGQNREELEKSVRNDVRLKKNNQNVEESGQNSNTQTNLTNRCNKICLEPYGGSIVNKSNNTKSHNLKSKSNKYHGICSLSEPFHSGSEKSLEMTSQQMQLHSKKVEIQESGEIDCSMGASFSDALVMCCGDNNRKQRNLKRHSLERNNVKNMSKQKKPSEDDNIISKDLISQTQNLNNAESLPKKNMAQKIVENYAPNVANQKLMKHIYCPSNKEKSDFGTIDVLSVGISSKTKRTKVYSGLKTGALLTVPSLFDICIRVLQKNIDALEFTGGVPFDVLRPVLERTSPQQLLAVENFNSYLLEDTDILWEQHVKRNFRKGTKLEDETWREMFLRCENEKECRLSILTTNIKKAQRENALPVRKTRLAYVDHVAKPPRNILRKQEIFGTNLQLIASPAARVPSLSSNTTNVVKAGDPRLKNVKPILHAGGNTQVQQKRAPLMAKTLKFIKKRYKR